MTEADWLACAEPEMMLAFVRGKVSDRKVRLYACACCRRIWHLLPGEGCKQAVRCAERRADGRETEEGLREATRDVLAEFVTAGAAAQAAMSGTFGPMDCLDDHPDRDRYQEMYDQAYAAAAQAPADACEAWAAMEAAWAAHDALTPEGPFSTGYRAVSAVDFFYGGDGWETYCHRYRDEKEKAAQRGLLEDVVGNPFRTPAWDPAWATPAVAALATAAYEDRALPSGALDAALLAVLADALEEAGCTDRPLLDHCRNGGPHVRGCWAVDLVRGQG